MSRHRIVIFCALGLAALPLTLVAQGLTSPEAAIQQRQIRALQQRSVTQPVAPQVQQQRRALIRDSGGVALDQPGAILDRQLDSVPRSPQVTLPPPIARASPTPEPNDPARANQLPSTVARPPDGLENSYTGPGGVLPSIGTGDGTSSGGSNDPVTMANRLIARAQASLDTGRPDRARSDAEFAGRLLSPFERVQPGDASFPRLASARERLNLLRDRLTEAE